MNKIRINNKYLIPTGVFIILLLIAFFSEWEYDESWTYMGNLDSSLRDILLYTKFKRANNHILNSLWFHVLQSMHIKPVFVYRLISLACFSIYVYAINKLIKYSIGNIPSWNVTVFYFMPYIIYFTLGRGYAMAITSFVAALYFYKLFSDTKANRHLLYFIMLGSLSSLSIYSFCFPFIAMMIMIVVYNFRRILLSPSAIGIMSVSLPVIGYVFYAAGIVNKFDTDIIGSTTFFRNGTVSSMVTFICLYDYLQQNLFIIVKAIFCLSFIPVLFVLLKRKKLYTEWAIIAISITLMAISHYLFLSKYPLYRSVSYLFILLYLPVVYTNSFKRNLFITVHLIIISLIGLWGLAIAISNSFKPNLYDALQYVATHPVQPLHTNTILIDNMSKDILVYDKLYFNDSIKIFQLEDIEDDILFFKKIDSVNYVICADTKIRNHNKIADFSPQYKLATDVYPNTFFIRK